MKSPVRCHIDARLAQDQHRGLRVMLEGQAAFRRSWWRRKKECQDEEQLLSSRQGSPTRGPDHPPFVWSTTVAGFPAPIITTRSIQIGVSKWPLGSAELEEAKWTPSRKTMIRADRRRAQRAARIPGPRRRLLQRPPRKKGLLLTWRPGCCRRRRTDAAGTRGESDS